MYTRDDLDLLDETSQKVIGKDKISIQRASNVLDNLRENNPETDYDILMVMVLREYFLNFHFLLSSSQYLDLDLDNILFTYPLEKMPLYLNKEIGETNILQEVAAVWRLKLGR